jgi:hypothetical protein
LAVFEAPHPFNVGELETRAIILHRDNASKVEVLRHPEKYRQQWAEYQAEQRRPYQLAGAERNPLMSSPRYPWNRSQNVEEQSRSH